MHRRLTILVFAAAAALTLPALAAQDDRYPDYHGNAVPELGAGAVAGTTFGVGLANGWWGSSATIAALPSTAAGATAVGGVVGVGTAALLDAVIAPCRGFHAIFDIHPEECVNGVWVGPHRVAELHRHRRVVR